MEPFSPRELWTILHIKKNTAGTFPSKHCIGNKGGTTELFVRVSQGRYRLDPDSPTVICLRKNPSDG